MQSDQSESSVKAVHKSETPLMRRVGGGAEAATNETYIHITCIYGYQASDIELGVYISESIKLDTNRM